MLPPNIPTCPPPSFPSKPSAAPPSTPGSSPPLPQSSPLLQLHRRRRRTSLNSIFAIFCFRWLPCSSQFFYKLSCKIKSFMKKLWQFRIVRNDGQGMSHHL
ncbi:hypothetical protein HA466_0314020 [Hirschfeldia incana]|nr:hypothetical protein HA466_0314020 [Hirschfeldia incana]